MALTPDTDQFSQFLRLAFLRSPNFATGVSGWTINQDGSAEFNNLTVRGTFLGSNWIMDSTGLYFYSGVPALGNPPIAYIAKPGVTTDPKGNTLPATSGGFISVSGSIFSQLVNGTVVLRNTSVNAVGAILSAGNPGLAQLSSPLETLADISALFSLYSKAASSGGAASQGTAVIGPNGPSTSELLEVQGNIAAVLVKAVISGVEETWHVVGAGGQPPFLNFFSAGGTAPRFQLEPVGGGRVRMSGAVNTGAVNPASTAMFTLPAGYRPARKVNFVTQNNITAYTLGSGSVEILTTGDVTVVPATTAGKFVLLDGICFELD